MTQKIREVRSLTEVCIIIHMYLSVITYKQNYPLFIPNTLHCRSFLVQSWSRKMNREFWGMHACYCRIGESIRYIIVLSYRIAGNI